MVVVTSPVPPSPTAKTALRFHICIPIRFILLITLSSYVARRVVCFTTSSSWVSSHPLASRHPFVPASFVDIIVVISRVHRSFLNVPDQPHYNRFSNKTNLTRQFTGPWGRERAQEWVVCVATATRGMESCDR